jgi:hypothetical protein
MINSTTTCSAAGSSTLCTTLYAESTSTDQTIVNGFTAGEIVISVELFITMVVAMVILYHMMFKKIKIRQ